MFVIFILTASMRPTLSPAVPPPISQQEENNKNIFQHSTPARSLVSGPVGVKIFEVGLKKNKLEITEERGNL